MKAAWQLRTLGDFFDITSSKRVFKEEWTASGVPFFRAREIVRLARDGYVDNELFIDRTMYERYRDKYGVPDDGDILVTGVGTLGICYVVQGGREFYFKDGNIIWLKKKGAIDSRFVEYAFKSNFMRKQIDDSIGATVGTFTIDKAKRTKIPVPPLEEQRRIVAVLDEAFAAIATATANAQKNLTNARELFGAIFAQTLIEPGVGWSVMKIRNVADLVSGQHIDASDYNNAQRGIGYLTGPSDFGERTPVVTKWTEHPKRTALRGDLLITVKGSGVGSVNMMDEEELAISRQLMAVRVNKTDPELIYYALEAGFEYFQRLATGAAIPGISRDHVLDFKIAIPPESDLIEFMSRLHSLRATSAQLTENYRQQIFSLTALKQSLLHRAFTGDLTAAMRETIAA